MNAVRTEVEELKEKIVRLEEMNSNLQNENEVLKRNIPSDVLRQISNASTPQLTIQEHPSTSTLYQNVIANQSLQQSLPATVPIGHGSASTNIISIATTSATPGSNPINHLNTSPAAAPGIVNMNQSSQITSSFVPQPAATNVPLTNVENFTTQTPQ